MKANLDVNSNSTLLHSPNFLLATYSGAHGVTYEGARSHASHAIWRVPLGNAFHSLLGVMHFQDRTFPVGNGYSSGGSDVTRTHFGNSNIGKTKANAIVSYTRMTDFMYQFLKNLIYTPEVSEFFQNYLIQISGFLDEISNSKMLDGTIFGESPSIEWDSDLMKFQTHDGVEFREDTTMASNDFVNLNNLPLVNNTYSDIGPYVATYFKPSWDKVVFDHEVKAIITTADGLGGKYNSATGITGILYEDPILIKAGPQFV